MIRAQANWDLMNVTTPLRPSILMPLGLTLHLPPLVLTLQPHRPLATSKHVAHTTLYCRLSAPGAAPPEHRRTGPVLSALLCPQRGQCPDHSTFSNFI